MKISLIVPAYNEERLIGQTLKQLRLGMAVLEAEGCESELIVCNNNSSDRTGELAKDAGARVVFEPINQIARARNAGAAAATGQWLVFVDADSRPSENLFLEVFAQIQSGVCLAGGCTMKFEGGDILGHRLIGIWNWLSRRFVLIAGAFIFCETAAFKQIGGFSNELFASEELDLTKRLKQLARRTGKKIVILYQSPVITSPRKLHLYKPREYFRFLIATVATGGRTLRRRESCPYWYDGRR